MTSLTSPSTVYHNSLQQQFSTFQSHSPLVPFTYERLNILASPSQQRSVFEKKRLPALSVPELPTSDAAVNAAVPDDREPEVDELKSMVNLIAFKLQPQQPKRMSYPPGTVKSPATVSPSTSPLKMSKRSSRTLQMTPSAQEQFGPIMEDVKGQFGKRQYTKCSTRCRDALDNFHQPPENHALHVVYLCFYNAIALEQTARSYHNSSPRKRAVFLESLEYFQKAATALPSVALTSAMKSDYVMDSKSRQLKHSSMSSSASSNRSSIDSVFSQASFFSICSDASSRPASPQEHDGVGKGRPTSLRGWKSASPRVQKRVSFAQVMPTLISHVELSLEEEDESSIIDSFPLPPPSPPLPAESESQPPPQQQPQSRSPLANPQQRPSSFSNKIPSPSSTSPYQSQCQHHSQYGQHLKSFSSQLQYHIRSINAQLDLLNQHDSASRREADGIPAAAATSSSNAESKWERIMRLKAQGWPRRRFDATRYQDLCEKAMTEMSGC